MYVHSLLSDSYHSFRIESAELLHQLFAPQLAFAFLPIQASIPQLIHHLAQLLVHHLATLAALMQLCIQVFLLLTVLF